MLIENGTIKVLFRVLVAAILAFILLPLITVVVMSFNASRSISFPPESLTTDWYTNYFESSQWMRATITSLQIGAGTALLTTVLATLAAYALTRGTFRGKDLSYVLLLTPLVVPTMVLAIAFYFFFSDLQMTGSLLPVIIGHTVITLPIVLVTVSSSLQGISQNLERASMSLGASRLTTFFRVVMPLMIPGMVSGALFSFLLSFDELLLPLFLGGVGTVTLPTQIWGSLNYNFDQTISAVSTLIIVAMAFLLVVGQAISSKAERGGR